MKLIAAIFVALLLTNPTIALSQHYIENPFFVKKQPVSEADAVRANNAVSLFREHMENDGQDQWKKVLDFMEGYSRSGVATDEDWVSYKTFNREYIEFSWVYLKVSSEPDRWGPVLDQQNLEYLQSGKFESEFTSNFNDLRPRIAEVEKQFVKKINSQKELVDSQLERSSGFHEKASAKLVNTSVVKSKDRFYRDSSGRVVSESEVLRLLSDVRTGIKELPPGRKKTVLEGALRAMEQEWDKTRARGPIEDLTLGN